MVDNLYEEELKDIISCDEAETRQLLKAIADGDDYAKNRLVEGNLKRVLDVVGQYCQVKVPISDLIQEGNMALTMAVYNLKSEVARQLALEISEISLFTNYIDEKIKNAVDMLLEEENESEELKNSLATKINVMNEVVSRLTKELDRQPTIRELSQKMKMDEEEVKELMQMALNAANNTISQK